MANAVNDCGKVGYAYVPEQVLDETYEPQKGLKRGTIFPELDLPIEVYGKEGTLREVR